MNKKMENKRQHLSNGAYAEQLAETYLKKKGLKLLEKNYRCKTGEVDLIFEDKKTLVFVEVRFRSNIAFGGAIGSIDARKQKKIISAAKHYLLKHPDKACRFDAILLDSLTSSAIDWLPNAFDASLFDY